MSMMEATRYQVKPKNENASYGNPSREQQLAHLRETLHDLPTAESLAELIIPSAPPLEETYEDNSAFSLYNGPVIPSAPPMEDSNHNGAVFQFQQSDQTVYSAIKNTPSSNVKASKTVSMISENINSDAGETHFFNKNLDSSCFIKSPTTYYSNEKSTVDSKTTWPEHVLSNDDHKIDNRYAPENIIPLFECVSSNNEKYLNLQLPNTLQLSHFEKDQMRQHCDEKKVHHMEFTQDGYKLKDYVSELNVSAEVEQHQVIHLYSTLQASRKFVDTIKKRCSLVSRHVDGKISKRAVLRQSTTAQSIIDFKNNVVPRIRNQYAPDHIFNVDQTGIVLEETTKRTLAKRGTDKVFRVCQRDNPTRHSMTFNPCISADGKLTGKLFVTLYEPKPPRSFRQMVAPFTDLHVTHSTSGIMTTRLAEEWMEKCLLPSIPDRSVLLLDSWHGFDKMKVLRAVARKNLEIVTFPPRTTGQLQPLDLFFNRQLKCFLRKLQDEIRLKHNDFTISVRNNLLKVARFTQNQFQAPRFAPMIQRGFYELGIVTTRPTFDTPAEFCFDPEVGKEKCKTCTNLSFFKCAHCEETYCIKCTIDHFH
ncbi:unnamed protein product [Caenorhabditis nigoni]